MATDVREARRVSVTFSDEAYQTLDRLARKRGANMSDVLRHAIALEAWFDRTQAEGGRVLVERDGEIREIVTLA